MANWLVLLFTTCILAASVLGQQYRSRDQDEKIPYSQLENWALSFGTSLYETARQATKFDAIQKRFHTEGAKIEEIDGFEMVKRMAANVETMMQHKIDAIKRIMELAENLALDHDYEKDLGKRLKMPPQKGGYHYINAKKLNLESPEDEEELPPFEKYLSVDRNDDDPRFAVGYSRLKLEANKYFSGIPVNTNMSVVHVPTNVFDGDPKVANAIDWSSQLDLTFRDNYNRDPSLSWQYFGSSTGFMRQYPAMKWMTSEHDPDLYDARMRDWYIKAAASPKEIVILLDTSGSMTGLRKEIAKHVVLNILETLSEDDFVTIYKFSKHPTPLVPCFTDENGRAELVQATNENIREFQEAVNNVETEEIANFTSSLTVAFELLRESHQDDTMGANCNQAIMLVTDGVPYKYEEIFKTYNMPHKPVRVFTYLIGREISDLKAANWMACSNRGYFTHVTTLGEVKEQVLKYIPVMARPMVMYRDKHPIIWTGVYADIEVHDHRDSERPMWMIKLPKPLKHSEIWDYNISDMNEDDAALRKDKFTGYRLMTSVSIPVFDKKNHTDPERLGLSKSPEGSFLRKVRIAQLLGVAGTDVPIREIEKLTTPYELGVNGYAFAVNNNGYVLFHPDLRPMFQEILKPNYNSVDLTEVELVDNAQIDEPRGNDTQLLAAPRLGPDMKNKMRKEMVNQQDGQNYMRVRQHFDDMKRATLRTQDYSYHPISNTPFSLGIALPRDYGKYRVKGEIEVSLAKFNISDLFVGNSWRLHPDWVYCEYNYAGTPYREFHTPEDNMKHFFVKMQQPDWNWGTPNVLPLPNCKDKQRFSPNCFKSHGMEMMDANSHVCNDELVKSLIFDAVVTNDFENQKSPRSRGKDGNETIDEEMQADQPEYDTDDAEEDATEDEIDADEAEMFEEADQIYKKFGIQLAFIATRSGLMRFSDHSKLFRDPNSRPNLDPDMIPEPPFADINNKAIEEVWYKRAVDYHIKDPKAFVYSVPFDVGKKKTQVTASHAIMVGKGSQKSPAAVAGMQIDYDKFRQMFFDQTKGSCSQNDDLACYVVDNNGFVIISDDPVHTGKFFGEVDGTILDSLIKHQIYKTIQIYDYQAICLEREDDGSSANFMLTPFKMMAAMFNYILGQIAWTIIRFEIHHLWNPDWTYAFPQSMQEQVETVYEDVNMMPDADVSDDMGGGTDYYDPLMDEFSIKDGGRIPLLKMTYINKTSPRPCDKQVQLYELNESRFNKNGKAVPVKGKLSNCHSSECERPFSVNLIPHTNLIMIVADKTCPCFSTKITIEPTKVEYGPANETAYCERLKYSIYRRKPTHCLNYHAEETEIKLCGGGSSQSASAMMLALILFVQGWITSSTSS